MSDAVSPESIASSLSDYWSPKVIGEVDNSYVKVAKLLGDLTWHCHEGEDELFYILKGELIIELKDKTISLKAGEMYVVPRGVMHNPIAKEECLVLLFERKSTLHTGDIVVDKTRTIEEQL